MARPVHTGGSEGGGRPPRGGGKGKGGNGKGQHNAAREQRANLAVTKLQNALIAKGFSGKDAYNFARMALSQKGVTIGESGRVHYKGSLYKSADFATSPLVQYVTGEKAKALNQAKIEADPNYQSALAQLKLTMEQNQSGLDAQRRQALVDFGDPTFVQNDPVLAAAVNANKFGTSQLLQRGYNQDLHTAQQTANQAGTLFGGGAVAGRQQAQRQFAGSAQQSTSALQNLLNSLSLQSQQFGQNYNLGAQNALLQTQQNLAQMGTLSASAPRFHVGNFRMYRPPRRQRMAGGGATTVRPPNQQRFPNPGQPNL